jgi:ornithine carbamoyltransferase
MQVLGDLATVQDHKRQLAGLRVALLSAGGPVTASWLRAARALRLQLTCVCPPGHEPDVTTVKTALRDILVEVARITQTVLQHQQCGGNTSLAAVCTMQC